MALPTLLGPPTPGNLPAWQFEHAMAHRELLGAMAGEIPSGIVIGATITDGGSGYTSAPAVTINSSTGTGAQLSATIAQGVVNHITVSSSGQNYQPTHTITISGGGGTGATATLNVGNLIGSFYGSAGLQRFSAIPYFIDPQRNIAPWHLDHGQAHSDYEQELPIVFGSLSRGVLDPTNDY